MEHVGHEVKRLREERNWSQAKLAVEADMSVSGVSMIENGRRNLTTTTLAKLARAFGVEVADLFPKPRAYFVPPEEGEEPDIVTLRLYNFRLLEENDRLLQEVTRLRRQLEKAGLESA